MQDTPLGWPEESAVSLVPEGHLVFDGSAWPPAGDGLPAGEAIAGSWSVDRTLTGGGLPGSARGASGGSIAQAEAQIPQPAAAPLSPFGEGARQVNPGGLARLSAVSSGVSIPLGKFQVRDVSGASTQGFLGVELEEASQALKRKFFYPWRYDAVANTMDAAHVIDVACTGCGYLTDRAPLPGADRRVLVDLPLAGRATAGKGGTMAAPTPVQWSSVDGRMGMSGGRVIITPSGNKKGSAFEDTARNVALFVEVAADGGSVHIVNPDTGDGVRVKFDLKAKQLRLRQVGPTNAAIGDFPFTTGSGAYMLHLSRATDTGQILTVRVRQSGSQTFETLGTVTTTGLPAWTRNDHYHVGHFDAVYASTPGGWLRGFQAYWNLTDWDVLAALPIPEVTAKVEASGSLITGVFLTDTAQTAWQIIQDLAKSTMGAAWMNEAGQIIYRNRQNLRTGTPVETIISEERLDSLAWTMSIEDVADRVALTYTPSLTAVNDFEKITLWESTDTISVPPFTTFGLEIDITGTTDRLANFIPLWDTTTAGDDGSRMSRWAAATSADGAGERPSSDSLTVEATLVGLSKVKINVRNNTGDTLYLVDGNGNPCLILRTSLQVQPGEVQTITSGASEANALTPFDFDCGQWVQDAATAQEMLDWLTSQTQIAQPVIKDVNIVPDLARQLGDIVVITDEVTGLRSKALLTSTGISGDSSVLSQTVTAALLADVFRDFDAWARAEGIDTFDDLDLRLAELGIDTFDDFDRWASSAFVNY